jgi:predicted small secreted protein
MNKTIVVATVIISVAMVISASILASAMGGLGKDIKDAGSLSNNSHSTFVVKLANWDTGLKVSPIDIRLKDAK